MKIIGKLCGVWAMVALLMLGFVACSEDDTDNGSFMLHYPEVSNIGPSMSFISGTPSYYGDTPSDFSIVAVKLDGATVECDSFSINPQSGAVTISNTESMTPGCYTLSISCVAAGATYTFDDIFVVNMLPASPISLEVSQKVLEIPYAEVKGSESTITLTPVGESVTITGYQLVQNEGEEYFSVSTSGVIGVNKSFKGDIPPGVYDLTLKLSTHAVTTLYENIATIKVTSAPIELLYNPNAGRMEYNTAYTTLAPTMKGSMEEVVYSIKGVTPECDKFSIDPSTGVISIAADNNLEVDSHYVIDVNVANLYGSTDFMEAFTLDVIAYIEPIDASTFTYADVNAIQGTAFTAAKSEGMVGDEVTFSLVELPAELEGQLSIDAVTGEVSAKSGNTIPLGSYTIKVKAQNTKSEVEAELKITIVENPYYFTTISYGNNLGLDAAANASQFRCPTKGDFTALELKPTTDAKEGTPIEWSVKIKHQMKGTTIDSATGQITLVGDGFKANNGGLILVTATAGKGEVGETSVTIPVFFSFVQEVSGVTIHYNPFVFRVNPRKGGVSVIPEISGVELSQLVIDYRRTFNYYNIAGPETHIDGQPSTEGSFMRTIWDNYYGSMGAVTNTGQKNPVSYYANSSNLAQAMLYVNAVDKSVVVNPGKWIDAEGNAANGAFIGQTTFVTNGDASGVNNGSQVFPIWVWFDEKF